MVLAPLIQYFLLSGGHAVQKASFDCSSLTCIPITKPRSLLVTKCFIPLSAVGSMASLAFLIVYGTVSAGHLRVYRDTGAKPSLLVLAVVLNAALFVLLLGYTIHTGPASTWITLLAVLALSFVFEIVYRKRTGRTLKTEPQRRP